MWSVACAHQHRKDIVDQINHLGKIYSLRIFIDKRKFHILPSRLHAFPTLWIIIFICVNSQKMSYLRSLDPNRKRPKNARNAWCRYAGPTRKLKYLPESPSPPAKQDKADHTTPTKEGTNSSQEPEREREEAKKREEEKNRDDAKKRDELEGVRRKLNL